MPLVKVCISFCIGILLCQIFSLAQTSVKYLSYGMLCLPIVAMLLNKKCKVTVSFLIAIFFTSFAIVLVDSSNPENISNHIFHQTDNEIFIVGELSNIKTSGKKKQAHLGVNFYGRTQDSLFRSRGNIICYFDSTVITNLCNGDLIIVNHKINGLKHNQNPHAFDYASFLEKNGIYNSMYLNQGDFLIFENQKEFSQIDLIGSLRKKCIELINRNISNPNNQGILIAMILGDKTYLDEKTETIFKNTGAIHVLAVSGLHVGIISLLIHILLRGIPINSFTKVLKLFIVIGAVWTFALITGAAPAVLRAATMYSIFFVGKYLGKPTNIYNILAGTCLIMLLFDPNQIFLLGFQFSFLALTSIVLFFPMIEKYFISDYWLLSKIGQLIAVSVSAQVLIAPLMIYYFHQFPVYFWLSGIIAVPLAFIIVILGVVLILFASIIPESFLVSVLSTILEHSLSIFELCLSYVEKLPCSVIKNLWLYDLDVILMYFAIAFITIAIKKQKPKLIILGLSISFIQCFSHQYRLQKNIQEDSLIVYDINKELIIDVFSKAHFTTIPEEKQNSQTAKFNCTNYRLSKHANTFLSNKAFNFEASNGVLVIGKNLIVTQHLEDEIKISEAVPINLLILHDFSMREIESLLKKYEILHAIIPKYMYRKKEIKELLKSTNIGCHDMATDGPFIFKLNE